MVKQRIIADLAGWGLIALICFFFLGACNPQRKLNRLISNNPELAKTDTVYSTKNIWLPGFHIDTTFNASNNVNGLNEIFEAYKQYIDSVNRARLVKEVKNYIVERKCLEDTFYIALNNNGSCKIWQVKDKFHYQLSQPGKKYEFTVPVSVQQINVVEKNNWKFFWIGFSILPGICIISFVIIKAFKS